MNYMWINRGGRRIMWLNGRMYMRIHSRISCYYLCIRMSVGRRNSSSKYNHRGEYAMENARARLLFRINQYNACGAVDYLRHLWYSGRLRLVWSWFSTFAKFYFAIFAELFRHLFPMSIGLECKLSSCGRRIKIVFVFVYNDDETNDWFLYNLTAFRYALLLFIVPNTILLAEQFSFFFIWFFFLFRSLLIRYFV